jgi:phosphatidate cytidylyltransferase
MKRVLTALVLAPLVVWLVLAGPDWLLFAITALVAVICYHEYAGIAAGYPAGSPGPLGYGAGLLLLLAPAGEATLVLASTAILALLLAMRAADLAVALPRAAAAVLGLAYIFGCWKFAILLRAAGPHWLMFALALNWLGDTGAYAVGRRFGRRRLAPRISPAKSWEGAAASIAVSVAFGYLYLGAFLPAVPPAHAMALAALANGAGQLGDLAESALKRGARVKDSGSLLPGHGGLLDRVDSTLFTLPVVYLYVRLV